MQQRIYDNYSQSLNLRNLMKITGEWSIFLSWKMANLMKKNQDGSKVNKVMIVMKNLIGFTNKSFQVNYPQILKNKSNMLKTSTINRNKYMNQMMNKKKTKVKTMKKVRISWKKLISHSSMYLESLCIKVVRHGILTVIGAINTYLLIMAFVLKII